MIPLAPFLLTGFLALLVFLMLIGGFVLAALKIMFGGGKKSKQMDAEEARLMQDIHKSLQKLKNELNRSKP
jgi:hypothetical protein